MIRGFVSSGQPVMALSLYSRMLRDGMLPAKEAFQRLQLKEDERNVLQIVTYKKGITTMVMGMWRLRDMESIEAIFTETQSREDEAELQVLNGWLQSMARVNSSLGIISNNEG
ncbi:hypothetical protein EJ110_NYTH32389 [Nymphaea thermarum]|nr:hypothetical protein EJ110_NYTH32389 [Nymphaea thermarum]